MNSQKFYSRRNVSRRNSHGEVSRVEMAVAKCLASVSLTP